MKLGLYIVEDDFSLIRRYIAGETACFEELVKRHWKRAISVAYQTIGDYEEAKDISQEAFTRVLRSISQFRFEASFSTWLSRIVVNLSKNYLQRTKKKFPLQEEAELEERATPCNLDDRLQMADLKDAINSLKEPYRMCIILKDIEGFSYKETARILDCPIGTVMSRLNAARRILRKRLKR
ncbi:TPA: RNA polymerase subunit sigma-24 [bacterium]|nr:RNA polymerase subunit sigma-24 [bacterium]